MPSEDCTYTFALLLPMSNFMAFGPPIFFMRLRDSICPSPMKMIIGSTQHRILTSSDVCWISVPLVEMPASSSRETRLSSGTMAVL